MPKHEIFCVLNLLWELQVSELCFIPLVLRTPQDAKQVDSFGHRVQEPDQ